MTIPKSTLTKSQAKTGGWKEYTEGGEKFRIRSKIRFDDQCGNGHNTFAITGETYRQNVQAKQARIVGRRFLRLHP